MLFDTVFPIIQNSTALVIMAVVLVYFFRQWNSGDMFSKAQVEFITKLVLDILDKRDAKE